MGLGSEYSVLQSMDDNKLIAPEELGKLGGNETKLKSNGVCHVEDVNGNLLEDMGPSSPAVNKRQGLKKWRRIPRELVKKSDTYLNGRKAGDFTASTGENRQGRNGYMVNANSPVSNGSIFANGADSANSDDQSSRSSTAASAPRMRHEISVLKGGNSDMSTLPRDHHRNGQTGNSKKARGVKIEKENSISSIGSDSRSSNFVFVQGTNSVATKSRESGAFVKYDEDYSDDAHYADIHLNEEAKTDDAESEDVSQDVAAENTGKLEESIHQDSLVESITGLDSAHDKLQKEVQKWKDIGKDDPLILDDSTHDLLKIKDDKISELESALISGDTKTELEDLLMKRIQADVEFVVINTTTKFLIEGSLNELKLKLQEKSVLSEELQIPKKQVEKVETKEDVKKLQNRVCRFTKFLMIQLILLLITLCLKFSSQNVEVVPT